MALPWLESSEEDFSMPPIRARWSSSIWKPLPWSIKSRVRDG